MISPLILGKKEKKGLLTHLKVCMELLYSYWTSLNENNQLTFV